MVALFSLLLGFVSGLRALTPLAVVSWAARLGMLSLAGTPLAFMGYAATPWIFSLLAVGELVNDKLPKTPSRKSPPQFIARIISGALAGATVGTAFHALVPGLVAGVIGAIAGTLGGAAVRAKLAASFGNDLPAALIEDFVAVALAIVAVWSL